MRNKKCLTRWLTFLCLLLTVPTGRAAGALLYDHGFETGDSSEFSRTYPPAGGVFSGGEAGVIRKGSYSGRATLTLQAQRAYVEQTLVAACPDLWVKCAFRLGPDFEVVLRAEVLSLIESDPRQPAAAIVLEKDLTLSLVYFNRGGFPVVVPFSRLQGTLERGRWYEVELHYRSDFVVQGPRFEAFLDGVKTLSILPAQSQSLIKQVCYGQRAEWLDDTLATGTVYYDLCKGSGTGPIGQETDKAAAVLVDRSEAAAAAYLDYDSERVKGFLDHLGLPYLELDVDSVSLKPELLRPFDLLILGQEGLGDSLDPDEQAAVALAVQEGSGLVSFDPWLDRYESPAFQEMLGKPGWVDAREAGSLEVPRTDHFITAAQPAEAAARRHAWGGGVPQLVLFDPGTSEVLAVSDRGPALISATYGRGRVCAWLTSGLLWEGELEGTAFRYLGHLHGADDLVWRGLVWACRKPMAWLPLAPGLVALKVDDCRGRGFGGGPFEYLGAAGEAFGARVHASLFLDAVDASESQALRALAQAGRVEVSAHAFDGGDTDPNERSEWFIYWDLPNDRPFPATELASRWQEVFAFFSGRGLSLSAVLAPSFGVAGSGNLPYFRDQGILYANMIYDLGTTAGTGSSLWTGSRPFRQGVHALDFLAGGQGPFNVSSWADYNFWSYDYLVRYGVFPFEAVDSPEEALENSSRQTRWAHAARFPMVLLTHEYVIEETGFDLGDWGRFVSLFHDWSRGQGARFLDLTEMSRLARDHGRSRILSYVKSPQSLGLLLEGDTLGRTEVEFWFDDSGPQAREVPAFESSRHLEVSWGSSPDSPETGGGCGCSHFGGTCVRPSFLLWAGPLLPWLAAGVWFRRLRRGCRRASGQRVSDRP